MATFNLRHFNSGTITSGLSSEDLQRMAESGQIDPKDEVRQDEHKTWHLVTTIKGLNIRHKTGGCDPPEVLKSDGGIGSSDGDGGNSVGNDGSGSGGDVPNHTGEYYLSEITGIDASGLLQEIFTLLREQEELESSWRGWIIWPILGVAGNLWGIFGLCAGISTAVAIQQETSNNIFLAFLIGIGICIVLLIPSLITRFLWRVYQRNNNEISRLERDRSKKAEEQKAKVKLQATYIKEVFKGWATTSSGATVGISVVERWNFLNGTLHYNEGGVAVSNPEEDRLSLIEANNISNVKYEFDRKHIGSESTTESNAAEGAVGAILGAVIGGLVFDSELDYGDVATAGVAGALVGGSNKRQSVENKYEEHAVVDIYSTSNKLSHLGVDFTWQQNDAKRFLSYIQNAMRNDDGGMVT